MNEGMSVQDLKRYPWQLFDGDEEAIKAGDTMGGMWAARWVRVSEIARGIFRFLRWAEPGIALNGVCGAAKRWQDAGF